MQRGGVSALFHIVLHVEESEDGRRCAHGLLEAVVEVGELAHRIVELEEQDDEGAEEPHGHVAVENLVAADEEEHGNGDGADGVHQGRTDGLNAHAAQVGAEQATGRFLEAQNLPQLGVERLHDAIAGDGFMQNVLNLGELVLTGAGAGANFPADLARGCDDHRNEQHQRPAELSAQSDHEERVRQRR